VNRPRPTIGDLMRPALAPGADTVPIGDVGAGTGNGTPSCRNEEAVSITTPHPFHEGVALTL